jgi:hypothetical protein
VEKGKSKKPRRVKEFFRAVRYRYPQTYPQMWKTGFAQGILREGQRKRAAKRNREACEGKKGRYAAQGFRWV